VIKSLGGQVLRRAAIERVDLFSGPELRLRGDADALRLILPPPRNGDFVPALRIRDRGLA
jgi:alpha-L-fucosidase